MTEEPTRPRHLLSRQLGLSAEHDRAYFHAQVGNDVLLSEIKKPGWWALVADRLKPGALVDVVRDDFTLDVQVRVIKIEPGLVDVRVRFAYADDSAIKTVGEGEAEQGATEHGDVPEGYKVDYMPNGAEKGYYVKLRDAAGTFVIKGVKTRPEAILIAQRHHAKAEGLQAA